jgi:hypothetical protein
VGVGFSFLGLKHQFFSKHLFGLFAAIFFAPKAGKKGFSLLSRSPSAENLSSPFTERKINEKIES